MSLVLNGRISSNIDIVNTDDDNDNDDDEAANLFILDFTYFFLSLRNIKSKITVK